jgi:uncharacterized protein YecE (DUF72 family)
VRRWCSDVAKVYAGTSGWSYPTWKPGFYPQKLAATKFLSHYATRLNTVEVNYTFRHFAAEKTQNGWCAQTPDSFQFSLKAHQRITHIKRLKDATADASAFLKSLQPLHEAGKLAFALFQLPPNLKADPGLLREFLEGVPTGKIAFEFRHESWFNDEVFDALKAKQATLCIAESEKLETPDIATSDCVYYRLRKGEYSAAEQKEIAKRIDTHVVAGRDVYVYFKHEETPDGALYAERLLKEFADDSYE